jgi:hypothetical protein
MFLFRLGQWPVSDLFCIPWRKLRNNEYMVQIVGDDRFIRSRTILTSHTIQDGTNNHLCLELDAQCDFATHLFLLCMAALTLQLASTSRQVRTQI